MVGANCRHGFAIDSVCAVYKLPDGSCVLDRRRASDPNSYISTRSAKPPFPFIDLVRAQLPPRVRDRLKFRVTTDPYYLGPVVYVESRGEEYSSGPIEAVLRNGKLEILILPDWFISHCCTLPLEDNP